MWSYILKRILLMIPTLLGVLTLTFAVIQFVPGGPVEQMVHELRKGASGVNADEADFLSPLNVNVVVTDEKPPQE